MMTIRPIQLANASSQLARAPGVRQASIEGFEQTFSRVETRFVDPPRKQETASADSTRAASRQSDVSVDDAAETPDTKLNRAEAATTEPRPRSQDSDTRDSDRTPSTDDAAVADEQPLVSEGDEQLDEEETQPAQQVADAKINAALASLIDAAGQQQTPSANQAAAANSAGTSHQASSQQSQLRVPADQVIGALTGQPSQGASATQAQSQSDAQTDGQSQQQQSSSSSQSQTSSAATTTLPQTGESVATQSGSQANGATATNVGGTPATAQLAPLQTVSPTAVQVVLSDADTSQPDANVARVARAFNNSISQNGGSLTLRLSPAELGTVRIELNIQGGNVRANLHAETVGVRDLLQQQISHLRSALESRGLTIERLEVQTMQNHSSSAFEQEQQTDQSAGDGRSRGRFESQQSRQQRAAQSQRNTAAFSELVAEAQG